MQNLINRLPHDGATVDIQPLFYNFTIDNSTEFLLGRSINCQTDPTMSHFSEVWDYAENVLPDRTRLGKLAFLLRDAKFNNSCDVVHRFVDDYIAQFLSSRESAESSSRGGCSEKPKQRYNVLSELSSTCSDRIRLRDELLNILLAARDTTAGLLSSIFYFLARHPDVWRRLATEVDGLQGRIPDYDTLKNMRYLRSVLDESKAAHPTPIHSLSIHPSLVSKR